MKKILFITLLFLGCNTDEKQHTVKDVPEKPDTVVQAIAPATHYTSPDLSPLDIVYFPIDYPKMKMTDSSLAPPHVRVIYSRPQMQGRKIFGSLVKYNQPWRLGANEATEIEFFSPATIHHRSVKAGRYILYCIPEETKWTIILNSNLYSWGLQQIWQKDLMKFEVPVEKNDLAIEYFTIAFEKKSATSADLVFLWDKVKTKLPISF